jgi:intein-encoded DNA endonuclease-like protein
MARGKTVEKSEIIQRQTRALGLKQDGWSYRAIAEKLEIDVAQAFRDVKGAVAELNKTKLDTAEDYVAIELERLDMLTKALEPMAAVGNIGSVSAYIRVMERRAKLLGLDAPEKKDLTSGGEKLEIVIRNADADR